MLEESAVPVIVVAESAAHDAWETDSFSSDCSRSEVLSCMDERSPLLDSMGGVTYPASLSSQLELRHHVMSVMAPSQVLMPVQDGDVDLDPLAVILPSSIDAQTSVTQNGSLSRTPALTLESDMPLLPAAAVQGTEFQNPSVPPTETSIPSLPLSPSAGSVSRFPGLGDSHSSHHSSQASRPWARSPLGVSYDHRSGPKSGSVSSARVSNRGAEQREPLDYNYTSTRTRTWFGRKNQFDTRNMGLLASARHPETRCERVHRVILENRVTWGFYLLLVATTIMFYLLIPQRRFANMTLWRTGMVFIMAIPAYLILRLIFRALKSALSHIVPTMLLEQYPRWCSLLCVLIMIQELGHLILKEEHVSSLWEPSLSAAVLFCVCKLGEIALKKFWIMRLNRNLYWRRLSRSLVTEKTIARLLIPRVLLGHVDEIEESADCTEDEISTSEHMASSLDDDNNSLSGEDKQRTDRPDYLSHRVRRPPRAHRRGENDSDSDVDSAVVYTAAKEEIGRLGKPIPILPQDTLRQVSAVAAAHKAASGNQVYDDKTMPRTHMSARHQEMEAEGRQLEEARARHARAIRSVVAADRANITNANTRANAAASRRAPMYSGVVEQQEEEDTAGSDDGSGYSRVASSRGGGVSPQLYEATKPRIRMQSMRDPSAYAQSDEESSRRSERASEERRSPHGLGIVKEEPPAPPPATPRTTTGEGVDEPTLEQFSRVWQTMVRRADFLRKSNPASFRKIAGSGRQMRRFAMRSAQAIMENVDAEGRGYLLPRDFFPFFATRNRARVAYMQFRRQARGAITLNDLASIIRHHQNERQRLMLALGTRDSIGETAETLVDVCFVLVMFLVILFSVYEVEFEDFWLFSTVGLSLSFVFGASLREVWDSLIGIFVVRPYDSGDIIRLADGSSPTARLIVRRIELLTTTFMSFSGHKYILKNTAILSKGVEQHTQGGDFYTQIDLHFEPRLTEEQLGKFRSLITMWLMQDGASWDLDDNAVWCSGVSPTGSIIVSMWVGLRGISVVGFFATRVPISSLLMYCLEVCRDLGISFFVPKRQLFGLGVDADVFSPVSDPLPPASHATS